MKAAALLSIAGLTLLWYLAAPVRAAGPYEVTWWTVDGGGGTSSNDSWLLRGTAGQPDAGVLNGGEYTLQGGLWAGGLPGIPISTPTWTATRPTTQTRTSTPSPSATATATRTLTGTQPAPTTGTRQSTPTLTQTATTTPPVSPRPHVCLGDCDRSDDVTVDELIVGVNIILGNVSRDECPEVDRDEDQTVTIDELTGAVSNALRGPHGCQP